MKKIFALAVLFLAMVTSCSKSDPVREDMLERAKNLPLVSGVTYDNLMSTSTSAAISWDANAALKAGAVSFKVQFSEDEYFFEGTGSTMLGAEVKSGSTPNDVAIVSGLTAGQSYFVRVAAVYPGPNRTAWVNLCNESGAVTKVIPGYGLTD